MDTVEVSAPLSSGPNPLDPDRVTVEKLKVLHDYLVIRPLAVPSKLAGSRIHMAETSSERERSHRGIVLAVGPGDFNEPGTALVPMTIEAGDLVFFGKYAGTEERVGADLVLVMRESETRFCVPEGKYKLVEHGDPKLDHLVEDWCEVCHGVPEEEAAAARLELEREAHRLQLQQDQTAREGMPDPQASALPEFPPTLSEIGDLNAQVQELAKKNKLTFAGVPMNFIAIVELSYDRRPCGQAGCQFMQRRLRADDTEHGTQWMWVGLRCGHVAPTAEREA